MRLRSRPHEAIRAVRLLYPRQAAARSWCLPLPAHIPRPIPTNAARSLRCLRVLGRRVATVERVLRRTDRPMQLQPVLDRTPGVMIADETRMVLGIDLDRH